MTDKQKNMKMQRLMCLTFLLLEDLDNLKVDNPVMLKYRDDLIGFAEGMSEEVKDTTAILKTTYFQQISHKFDTILRKSF